MDLLGKYIFFFKPASFGTHHLTVCANHIPVENLTVVVVVGHPGCPMCHALYSTVVQNL
jgi:hypothetical protein